MNVAELLHTPTPETPPAPVIKVRGELLTELPQDLYIPPDALEIFLDAFEGPLDLLLYLIRRQNLDVLDIPMAALTRQYTAYVEAARSLGAPGLYVIARHIAPNSVAPYLVLLTAHIGWAIVVEASLGFLGLGIPPPTPTWGGMLVGAQKELLIAPWTVIVPGAVITIAALAFNLAGDAIRDSLDPRLRQ
jgi:ABC-type antimicrobial peptide transport system permease subunit